MTDKKGADMKRNTETKKSKHAMGEDALREFEARGSGMLPPATDSGGPRRREMIASRIRQSMAPDAWEDAVQHLIASQRIESFKNKLLGIALTTLCWHDMDGVLPVAEGKDHLEGATRYYRPADVLEPRQQDTDVDAYMMARFLSTPEDEYRALGMLFGIIGAGMTGMAETMKTQHSQNAPETKETKETSSTCRTTRTTGASSDETM